MLFVGSPQEGEQTEAKREGNGRREAERGCEAGDGLGEGLPGTRPGDGKDILRPGLPRLSAFCIVCSSWFPLLLRKLTCVTTHRYEQTFRQRYPLKPCLGKATVWSIHVRRSDKQ